MAQFITDTYYHQLLSDINSLADFLDVNEYIITNVEAGEIMNLREEKTKDLLKSVNLLKESLESNLPSNNRYQDVYQSLNPKEVDITIYSKPNVIDEMHSELEIYFQQIINYQIVWPSIVGPERERLLDLNVNNARLFLIHQSRVMINLLKNYIHEIYKLLYRKEEDSSLILPMFSPVLRRSIPYVPEGTDEKEDFTPERDTKIDPLPGFSTTPVTPPLPYERPEAPAPLDVFTPISNSTPENILPITTDTKDIDDSGNTIFSNTNSDSFRGGNQHRYKIKKYY